MVKPKQWNMWAEMDENPSADFYTEMVLKMLNPSDAVLITEPGI
jgi:hypothetical protein